MSSEGKSKSKTLDVTPINQAEPQTDAGSKKRRSPENEGQEETQPDNNLAEGSGHHDGENPEPSPKPHSHGM